MATLKILIPVDGSDAALDAVRHLLALTTKGLRAQVVVANVQSPANLYELVVAHDPQVLQQVRDAAGHDLMKSAVDLLRAAGLPVEQAVASGDPAHALMELLERHGCEAVMLSAHGTSGERAHLGSVVQTLLQAAPVPVTVVRPRERADLK
jgi:nucleotide-binding universal stress UspA family protein